MNMSKDTKQKVEMGRCAKCGSDDVNYGNMEPDGESLYYEMDCNQCGAWMHEWYKLEFDGIDVMIEDTDVGFADVEYLKPGDTVLDEMSNSELNKLRG